MNKPLPQGISLEQFNGAIAEIIKIIGDEFVFTDDIKYHTRKSFFSLIHVLSKFISYHKIVLIAQHSLLQIVFVSQSR